MRRSHSCGRGRGRGRDRGQDRSCSPTKEIGLADYRATSLSSDAFVERNKPMSFPHEQDIKRRREALTLHHIYPLPESSSGKCLCFH
jgi:hypothetical protein